jgi:class 3 adenylate cyclase
MVLMRVGETGAGLAGDRRVVALFADVDAKTALQPFRWDDG